MTAYNFDQIARDGAVSLPQTHRDPDTGESFKDVLLQVSSYPEPTSAAVIEQAVLMAEAWGAGISALTFKVAIPSAGNALANALLDIPGMVATERQKSAANVQAILDVFGDVAAMHGVRHEQIVESCATSQIAMVATEHARLHDITIIPLAEHTALQHYVAESVVFGSGRPVIVIPQDTGRRRPSTFDTVGIAWDFSRPAARALADALPILRRAKSVRVVTITQEKQIDTRRSDNWLKKHLACHGIEAVLEKQDAAGRTIGQSLEDYATARDLDLLVMGAYGHSRLRDFILGGATKSIIANPPLPVLMSH
ncbi:universal stress protein [Pseudorhodoplanes sp.]|uniref:universal stress protein n=1 Tax=Pseudorhodoplanes sp. TaxID=1934341 RepID=UPI00391DBF05